MVRGAEPYLFEPVAVAKRESTADGHADRAAAGEQAGRTVQRNHLGNSEWYVLNLIFSMDDKS